MNLARNLLRGWAPAALALVLMTGSAAALTLCQNSPFEVEKGTLYVRVTDDRGAFIDMPDGVFSAKGKRNGNAGCRVRVQYNATRISSDALVAWTRDYCALLGRQPAVAFHDTGKPRLQIMNFVCR